MAVVEGFITPEDEVRATGADLTPPYKIIGQLLLDAGKIGRHHITEILLAQRHQALRFGDAARFLGLVSEADVQHALSRQFQYSYSRIGESDLSAELFTMYQPFSLQAEALRALRTQLILRWFQDRSKALAVVSARGGDGCSTIAANLAVVFAQLGERTLLIDANLRRPRLHTLFSVKPDAGLSGVLAGRGYFQEVLKSVASLDNLSILCAGPTPPNPQELLSRVRFSYIMEAASAAYDVVIVDAPGVLEYADAQIIAARAGGCLIVTRRHHTRVADVRPCWVR
jgi:chain length determinant protein tyrosine kinase EpsG